MEPNNDFKSLFAVKAVVVADSPICHTHMQASADKKNTQALITVLQSKRTVFPVTVKKSSSAKARNASSNISLVIAFGKKEKQVFYTYQVLFYLLQRHNAFNVTEPPVFFFFGG